MSSIIRNHRKYKVYFGMFSDSSCIFLTLKIFSVTFFIFSCLCYQRYKSFTGTETAFYTVFHIYSASDLKHAHVHLQFCHLAV